MQNFVRIGSHIVDSSEGRTETPSPSAIEGDSGNEKSTPPSGKNYQP